jgi:hypothetical protein
MSTNPHCGVHGVAVPFPGTLKGLVLGALIVPAIAGVAASIRKPMAAAASTPNLDFATRGFLLDRKDTQGDAKIWRQRSLGLSDGRALKAWRALFPQA